MQASKFDEGSSFLKQRCRHAPDLCLELPVCLTVWCHAENRLQTENGLIRPLNVQLMQRGAADQWSSDPSELGNWIFVLDLT